MEYNYKYATGRVPWVEAIAPEEVDDCFRVVIELFTEDWLNKKENNVVQRLWQAPYALATAEIYALGFALRRMNEIDKKFVKDKVALMQSADPKDVNGAMFEVFALSSFGNHYKVIPAKEGQPGYDGIIEPVNGKTINLSIKNYSISAHQRSFMNYSNEVEQLAKQYINQFKCPPLEIIINKKSSYPSAADWQELKDNLHGAFIEYNKAGKVYQRAEIGDWSIILQELIPITGKFAKNPRSYTLIISSKFHNNEEKNLFDKLDEAMANIVKHQPKETETVKNCVIIHLPMIASRRNCQQWVMDYFTRYPDKPLSAVMLIQPLVVTSGKGVAEYISIGRSMVARQSFGDDFAAELPLQFTMPIGKVEKAYVIPSIFIRGEGDQGYRINLINCYVYQQGHHFYEAEMKDGAYEVHIAKIASGITRHTVLLDVDVAGHHEPIDRLEML
ncbi:MAG: hypothetical protein WDO71_19125 [Bacteroidota bacterium]